MVVRRSKFRNVFADKPKRDNITQGIKLTRQSWDSDFVAVNPKFIAVAWGVGGGGAVGILKPGVAERLTSGNVPLVTGHTGAVLDLSFNPFNDNILATSSVDCSVKIWVLNDDYSSVSESAQNLLGHGKKVGTVRWNPVADNVLATSSFDYTVKTWDVSTGDNKATIGGFSNAITSANWNYNGTQLVTACKDKKMRMVDPRAGEVTSEVDRSKIQGTKGNRAIFLGRNEKVLSVGFGTGKRQYTLYDSRDLSTPLSKTVRLDNSSGGFIPYFDDDTDMLFLAGKGDTMVRNYEFINESNKFYDGLNFSYSAPLSAAGFMPKRGVDVNNNEIVKMYGVYGDQLCPVSFQVPRRDPTFAADIFIDCYSDEAALDAEAWFNGESAEPVLRSMEGGYVPKEAPTQTSFEKVEEETGPSTIAEYKAAYEEQKKRIAYLEAEVRKLGGEA